MPRLQSSHPPRIPAVQTILTHNRREDCTVVHHHDLLFLNFKMTDIKKEKKTKKSPRKDADASDEPKQVREVAVDSTESPKKKDKKEKKREKRALESEESQAKDVKPVEDTTSSPAKKKHKKEKKKKKDKKPAKDKEPANEDEPPTEEDPPELEGSMVEDQMVLIDRTKGIVYSGLKRRKNGDLIPIGKLENGKAVLDNCDKAVSGKLPFCFPWE